MIKIKKNLVDLYILIASIEFASGKLAEAEMTIYNGLGECGQSSALLYNKAFLALHKQDLTLAKDTLDEAIKVDSNFYEAWIGKAVISWMERNEEDATVAMKGAKKTKNPAFKAWLQRAGALKDPLDSISFYDKVKINFYLPEIFTMHYHDPLNVFLFDKLDSVFKK